MRFGPRLINEQRLTAKQTRLVGLGVGIGVLAIAIVVAQFAPAALAEAAGCSAGVIVIAAWVFWGELERKWFWRFMTAVVLVHGLVLRMAPWPLLHRPNKADILIGLGDLLLMGLGGVLLRELTRRTGAKRSLS